MAPETPKGVSSRLLTMKFMQRAAASASSAGSPDSEAPSSKKRKLKGSFAESRINANIDQALIQAALDSEEATRQAALAKHSSADTHWVLSNTLDKAKAGKTTTKPLNIVYVGYGDIDSSDDSGDNEDAPAKGRTSTRSVEKTGNKKSDQKHESADGDSDDQSFDESDEPKRKRKSRHSSEAADSPLAQNRSRSQSRSRHGGEGAGAKEFHDKRKKKDVRLNQLVSISAGGNSSFGSPNAKGATCHNCHQAGHKASDCPKRRSGRPVRKS